MEGPREPGKSLGLVRFLQLIPTFTKHCFDRSSFKYGFSIACTSFKQYLFKIVRLPNEPIITSQSLNRP